MKEWTEATNCWDVSEFYDEKYRRDGYEAFKGFDWKFFSELAKDFFGGLLPTQTLLDCGCGHGEFLEFIRVSEGLRHPTLCGVDLSPTAVKLAQKRLGEEASIFFMAMEKIDEFWNNYFDVITCWGSIEHTQDPRKTFSSMLKSLRPGGIIFITVPLEFEGCLEHIKNEPNKKNYERFATVQEWGSYFSTIRKPIIIDSIGPDALLIFRK